MKRASAAGDPERGPSLEGEAMPNEKAHNPRDFFNRELSWLAFNERVLEEAADETRLPLDRLKFLAIASSNLDEFFAVRVAGLRRLASADPDRRDPSGMTADDQLEAVRRRVRRMVAESQRCLSEEVRPLLEEAGVRRLAIPDLSLGQSEYLQELFEKEIFPVVTPVALDGEHRFPDLADGELCLCVSLEGPDGEGHVALVSLPRVLARIVHLPASKGVQFVLIEDLLRRYLPRLFNGHLVRRSLLFRVTRDADLSVEEERDEDFVELMSEVLRLRKRSPIVRLDVEKNPPRELLEFLRERLDVDGKDVYRVPGPLDLKAFFALVGATGLGALREASWTPQAVAELPEDGDFWKTLRARDVLLHHPYETFDPVVRLVSEAADDPDVLAIKQTLYRCSGRSKIIRALARAAEKGKHVTVLVELKARFDESRNIGWARELERAGVYVIYGVVGLKTHSKACLVVRREPDRIMRYVHLATGNYNESTARLYTDMGLLTSNDDIGSDISAFFNTITGYSQPIPWRKIEMAPLGMKQRILRMIRREADLSVPERPGLIMAKMNSLVDPDVIEALYAASGAGVRILLNVRGICCLRPGLKKLSETIEVVSIVGRFLEHSRVFYFQNGGEEEVYLASADWMPRNLEKRVELMFPVEQTDLKARVIRDMDLFFRDNVKARRLLPNGKYERVRNDEPPLSCQDAFMELALGATARAEEAARGEFRIRKPQQE